MAKYASLILAISPKDHLLRLSVGSHLVTQGVVLEAVCKPVEGIILKLFFNGPSTKECLQIIACWLTHDCKWKSNTKGKHGAEQDMSLEMWDVSYSEQVSPVRHTETVTEKLTKVPSWPIHSQSPKWWTSRILRTF